MSRPPETPPGAIWTWSHYAGLRRDLVRRSYDAYRWVEQRLSSSVEVPPGGFPARTMISRVDTDEPLVALTFDDGPEPGLTDRVLDLLAERGVVATFYLIGEKARRHPEIVERIAEAGHELGNHTWSHRFLTTQTAQSIQDELRLTDEAIADRLGRSPSTIRPPYGAVTAALAGWFGHGWGYDTILWSVDAADWEKPEPEEITTRVVSQTGPGSIVLLHDPVPATVEAVPRILDRLSERGLGFATIGELIAH